MALRDRIVGVSLRERLWSLSLGVAILGLLDAAYLTIVKLTHNEAQCIPGVGDCFSVNTSRYSEIMGIPIALLGAMAYLTIILLLLLETRGGFWEENAGLAIFGISLFSVLYSAYLTYLEIYVIRAICPFCIVSAIAMVILFVLSIARLASSQVQSNS